MNRAKLILLSCPVLLASMLLVANPAHANEVVAQPPKTEASAPTKQPIFEVVFERETPEAPMLEFTDEEANAAIQRYGCDCTSCLNTARQLQGQLPLQGV